MPASHSTRLVHVTVPSSYAAQVHDTLKSRAHAFGLTVFGPLDRSGAGGSPRGAPSDVSPRGAPADGSPRGAPSDGWPADDEATNTLITFRTADKRLSLTLEALVAIGVGRDFGTIDVIGLVAQLPDVRRLAAHSADRAPAAGAAPPPRLGRSARDRVAIDEMFAVVDAQSHLTVDWITLTLAAAFTASVGLVHDSPLPVLASFFLSPLMGPILSFAFGLAVEDGPMVRRGLRNELVGVLIAFGVGVGAGCIVAPWYATTQRNVFLVAANGEIAARGRHDGLAIGFLIAVPSGVGAGLGVTGDSINALVAVAIAASLLPPIVDSGLCLALGAWHAARSADACVGEGGGGGGGRDLCSGALAPEFLGWAATSFSLYLVNLVTVTAVAHAVFRLKGVAPTNREPDQPWRAFTPRRRAPRPSGRGGARVALPSWWPEALGGVTRDAPQSSAPRAANDYGSVEVLLHAERGSETRS